MSLKHIADRNSRTGIKMSKLPFFKSEEDLSKKEVEFVKIEKLPDGLFNLKIYAKDRFSGSGYVITLSRRQLSQLTEAVRKFEENPLDLKFID